MKKKTVISFLFAGLCLYGLARFCHHQTAGFKIAKITGNLFEEEEVFSPPCQEKEVMASVLSQRFTYLARGLQSFAFVSEDQKYVLKILNNQYPRRIFWHSLPLPFFQDWQEAKKTENQRKWKAAYQSYHIAYSELKDETALLYLHLHPTSLWKRPLTIVDKLGIEHKIDLDKTGFILQKKAMLAYPYLAKLKEENKFLEAKSAIRDILLLLVSRCKRGIADSDPLLRTNLGFIDGKPCLIDVGPFSYDANIQAPPVYKKEILRITASLRDWLAHHFPELVPDLDDELHKIL